MKAAFDNHSQEQLVCVVDGDPAVRDSLQYLCNSSGYPAIGFSTRTAFLRTLDDVRMSKTLCVICEAQLPDGSGVQLYEELKLRGFNIPFALLVSRGSGLAAKDATRAGIEYVWQKPIVDRGLLVAFLDKSMVR